MSAEHLSIANYDSLSEEEILSKLDILAESGSLNTADIRAYEKENQGRDAILKKLDELDGGESTPQTPAPEPQSGSQPGPTPGADGSTVEPQSESIPGPTPGAEGAETETQEAGNEGTDAEKSSSSGSTPPPFPRSS